MADGEAPTLRRAGREDMLAVAEIYLAAFPDSVADLGLTGLRPRAVADIMAICLDAEPEGFFLADVDGMPTGFGISLTDVRRLLRVGLPRLPSLLGRWMAGRYGVSLRAAMRLAREKLMFWRHADLPEADCPARMMSLAVHPRAQGGGVGRALFAAMLDYLRAQGVDRVRLEVRPDNAPARHIYETTGFRSVGRVHDTRGPWEVMVLDLEADDG